MTTRRRKVITQPHVAKKTRGPSLSKTAATHKAFVEAGLAAFLEHGFAGTRMSDVAARAGMAKGTIYLHFADKPALFADVLRQFVLETAGGRPLGRPKPGERTHDFLRRAIIPLLRGMQASNRFRVLYLVIAEGARFPELAEVYRTVAIAPVLRLVRVYAARAVRRGELRSDALARHPMLLAAPMVVGAMWNNLFDRDRPVDIATMFHAYLELIFTTSDGGTDLNRAHDA